MKKISILFTIILLLGITLSAQAQFINYQGVARDNAGNILINQPIALRLSVLSVSAVGTVVYVETHATTTDGYGLFTLQIGQGSVVTGVFNDIAWSSTSFFLKVEIDPTGGTNYGLAGTTQFAAVPYSLHAKTADNGFSGNYNDLTNQPVLFDGAFGSLSGKPTTLEGYGITDAMNTSHAANTITNGTITNWDAAFAWGNHAGLYRPITYVPTWDEVTGKPVFATVATSGSYNDLANLPVLFNGTWLSLTGKPTTLAGYGITDAMNTSHAVNAITTTNITNWNTAFAWGNHAGLYRSIGYVPAWDEVTGKPVFATVATSGNYNDLTNQPMLFDGAFGSLTGKPTTLAGYGITDAMNTSHAANTITNGTITNWNTAFAWGNHAGLYRPITYVPAWDEVTGKPIFATVATSGSYNDLANLPSLFNGTWLSLTGKPTTLAGYGITDGMATSHAANTITNGNITNWNTAFAWGNHAGLYRPIGYVPAWGEITANPFAFSAVANNQLLKYNSTSGKWENWTPNYLTSFTETDPIFGAWDKSSGILIVSTQVSDFASSVANTPAVLANSAKISYPPADAAKLAGIAAGAEVNVNADWNATSGDAQLLNKPILATVATTGSYNDLNNKPTGTNPGDMLYWNGTTWIPVPVGANGQGLVLNNGIPTWGGIQYPIVNTAETSQLTITTATSGGYIASDGGASVTARGVCWNTTPNPTVADSKTTDGAGGGLFASSLTGLTINTTYHARAYATNSLGTGYGADMVFATQNGTIVLTTDSATAITGLSATSGGNITADGGAPVTARGICFATTPDPTTTNITVASGSGTGSFTANLTGLSMNTTYYVRAYATNSTGTYYGSPQSFTTLAWLCGTSTLTINHITSGGVAPVDKTTTYGTVTNIPGETTKCWITSNLGASNQATSVGDATEDAAGWYFQFNKKQGFKHDGTTRTPATTWISSIIENSDWLPANDPCTLELGNGWRLPTSTEWSNVDASGGWTNWNGLYASGLKLHAAGYLDNNYGSRASRGGIGRYWSSSQYDASNGWYLYFDSGNSLMDYVVKPMGHTARCIKD